MPLGLSFSEVLWRCSRSGAANRPRWHARTGQGTAHGGHRKAVFVCGLLRCAAGALDVGQRKGHFAGGPAAHWMGAHLPPLTGADATGNFTPSNHSHR